MLPLGYACINTTLKEQGITTNRTLRVKTLQEKGLEYVSSLILNNVADLKKIVEWNVDREIPIFRMSSDIFPLFSHPEHGYDLEDLEHWTAIRSLLRETGRFALDNQLRLTYHPGQFNVLCSPKDDIVVKTVLDLEAHSIIMDHMGLYPSTYNKINIHLGGVYGDKQSAMERFCDNFAQLSDNAAKRITVENDDKRNGYSVSDLFSGVYEEIDIPIVFDYHHHRFCTGDMSEKEALEMALSTWRGVRPVTHYSESKVLEEGGEKETPAHSKYVVGPINTYGHQFDIMVEAKGKELAVARYHLLNKNN